MTAVAENPFSLTTQVGLRPAENALPLGWELSSERWQPLNASRVEIHLPTEAILLLNDEKED